jgi:hypothetical protein
MSRRRPKIPSFLGGGAPRKRSERAKPTAYLLTYPGSQELLRLAPTWEAVRERLRIYDLPTIVIEISRASALLAHHGFFQREEARTRLLDRYFPPGSERRWRIDYRIRREEEQGVRIAPFHELQLINALKLALLDDLCDDEVGVQDLTPLGEALLMLNALLEEPPLGPGPWKEHSESSRQRWELYLVANGLLNSADSDFLNAVRTHDLYLTPRPHLEGERAYIDLPSRVQELSGLPDVGIWAAFFAVNVPWINAGQDVLQAEVPSIDPITFFTSNFAFEDEEIEAVFRLLVNDPADLRAEARALYSGSIRPYHILPFAKRPLIKIKGRLYALSVPMLRAKLSDGIHHLLLDAEKARYLDYMGDVMDDHVADVFHRLYPSCTYLGEKDLSSVFPRDQKRSDAVLMLGDICVVIENKANALAVGIRSGEDWELYERKTKDIFEDAAEQIASTTTAIRNGQLISLGIDPARIQVYLPVVLTLEEIPTNPLLLGRTLDKTRAAGLLAGSDVTTLQVLSIRELYQWEAAVEQGVAPERILLQKATDETWWHASFQNYCLAHGLSPARETSSVARVRFNEIMDRVSRFFAARAKSPAP